MTKATSIGGRVTVVKSAAKRQLVVTTSGLPPLQAGKVYQLWLIGCAGNKIRSEGLLAAPHNGRTGPVLISGVLAGDTLRHDPRTRPADRSSPLSRPSSSLIPAS